MNVVIIALEQAIHFFSTYASQAGRSNSEKDASRWKLDKEDRKVRDETLICLGRIENLLFQALMPSPPLRSLRIQNGKSYSDIRFTEIFNVF